MSLRPARAGASTKCEKRSPRPYLRRETISYGIPAFTIDGKKIVWFAAFKKHVGFYPGSAAIAKFEDELTGYKTAKGSVQFPYDLPVPRALVVRMTKHAAKVRKP